MATVLVDGNYLLHRSMHIPAVRTLQTSAGKPTGGVFGFIKSLHGTLCSFSEITKAIVVFDKGKSERRLEAYADYKKRPVKDEVDADGLPYHVKFKLQSNYLRQILPKLGVKVVQVAGREGDDIIALLTRQLSENLIMVMSDDKDMLQLVDSNVHVWRPMAQEKVSLSNFKELVGVEKHQWMLRKAILGDKSDNVPGVPGVGEKTVSTLLKEFPDIGEFPHMDFFNYVESHKSARARKIFEYSDFVFNNYEILDLYREEFSEEETAEILSLAGKVNGFDVLAVKKIFEVFEFFSLIEGFEQWVTRFQVLK